MNDCLEWHRCTQSGGYGVTVAGGRQWLVHRLAMAEAFGEEAIKGKVVAHRCDNRICYRVDHLFVTDTQGNSDDMVAKGRSKTGERHWKAKLTETDIHDIRGSALTNAKLAVLYGISDAHVCSIRKKRKWGHV